MAIRGAGGSGGGSPASRASSRSRLPPKPGPALDGEAGRGEAAAHLAGDGVGGGPRAGRRAGGDRAISASLHIAGFTAGAKPSRNQASARPLQASSAAAASITATSRTAPSSGSSIRWKPRARPGQRASTRRGDIGELGPGRERARAPRRRVSGSASTEKIEQPRRRPAACARHSSSRASDVQPGPEAELADGEAPPRPPSARGRPQPARNTARGLGQAAGRGRNRRRRNRRERGGPSASQTIGGRRGAVGARSAAISSIGDRDGRNAKRAAPAGGPSNTSRVSENAYGLAACGGAVGGGVVVAAALTRPSAAFGSGRAGAAAIAALASEAAASASAAAVLASRFLQATTERAATAAPATGSYEEYRRSCSWSPGWRLAAPFATAARRPNMAERSSDASHCASS